MSSAWQPTRGILQPGNWRRGQVTSGGAVTQARVTFQAPAGAALIVDNASIGIFNTSGTPYETIATPVELLFSGVSGFSITTGATITSDWANIVVSTSSGSVFSITQTSSDSGWGNYSMRVLTGALPGNSAGVVVIMDLASSSSSVAYGSIASVTSSYYALSNSYNLSNPGGFAVWGANACYGVVQIETQ